MSRQPKTAPSAPRHFARHADPRSIRTRPMATSSVTAFASDASIKGASSRLDSRSGVIRRWNGAWTSRVYRGAIASEAFARRSAFRPAARLGPSVPSRPDLLSIGRAARVSRRRTLLRSRRPTQDTLLLAIITRRAGYRALQVCCRSIERAQTMSWFDWFLISPLAMASGSPPHTGRRSFEAIACLALDRNPVSRPPG